MKKKLSEPAAQQEETMYIINANCWKCKTPQRIALVRGDFDKRGGTTAGPDTFSQDEITIALSKGVILKEEYSNTANKSYLANSCSSCGNFAGNFFLFKDYFNPAELGRYTYETISL